MNAKYLNIDDFSNHHRSEEKKILLLADTTHQSQTVIDYINSFKDYSKNLITIINPITHNIKSPSFNYSAIIIHYSISILTPYYLNPKWSDFISKFKGKKLLIIQDEYRFINLAHYMINKLKIKYVLSSLNIINLKKVYPESKFNNILFVNALPGYISRTMLSINKKKLRKKLDIVYRSYELDSFYGKFGIQKNTIPIILRDYFNKIGMNVDININNSSRKTRLSWLKFVNSAKALLIIPGGSDFFDFTGEIYQKNELYKNKFPNMNKSELYESFLKGLKKKNITHKTLTPKIFEAMCSETILLSYTSIPKLVKDKHYILINKEISNLDEVVTKLNDIDYCKNLISNCKKEFVNNHIYHYEYLIEKIDHILDYE